MNDEKEMSFWGHIGELRGTLIRSLIAIVIGALIVGFNVHWIMDHIFFAPTKNEFPTFRVINHFSREYLGRDSFVLPDNFAVQQKKLFQQFNVMMAVAVFGGIVIALPYILWQLWKFIRPALLPNEKKNSAFFINFVWILFILGMLVGYYLILPFAINFGLLFRISDSITQLFDLSDYTTLFLQVVLGMGVLFQFPVIVYYLTNVGILTPQFLRTYRRHAIVLIMVVAAVVTPADVLSMMAAALPLLVLYEFSVMMSARIYKKQQKENATTTLPQTASGKKENS